MNQFAFLYEGRFTFNGSAELETPETTAKSIDVVVAFEGDPFPYFPSAKSRPRKWMAGLIRNRLQARVESRMFDRQCSDDYSRLDVSWRFSAAPLITVTIVS
jgi:hypothetical protein